MNISNAKWWMTAAVIVLVAALAYWRGLVTNDGLPPGIASGNGRIEAVEIHVATEAPGRVASIDVNDGDFVSAGEVLAQMDTATLEAQRRETRAQLQQATIGVETAGNVVAQREAEKRAAEAVLAQRRVERDAAANRLRRTREMADKGNVSQQRLDDDRAAFESARAAVAAAEAQVAASEAALGNARSQVIGARSRVDAARATVERIDSEIEDGTLRSPRDGRVQFRIAQSGEVLGAGSPVLSLVDLSDVYMTFFLPTSQAGRVAVGSEARLVLDAAPQYVIPARVSFVADVAQFTPKTVETADERQKLMFRVRARIDPALLQQHLRQVKTGLPGMAYVKFHDNAAWPADLQVRLPE